MSRFFLLILLIALPLHASRTVTDETGRTVTVPDHPHRIISLVPSVTDAIFALGAAADVVAVSDYTAYPHEATLKPSIGSILNPSLETIVSLHPDLLLAMKTQTGAGAVDKMRALGIPIYLVDPHGIEGIFHSILALGDALNRRPQADTLVAHLRQRVQAVRDRVRDKPVITVFMPIAYDPVITIGKGAFVTEMIAAAGARSVTDDLTQEWPRIGIELVVQRAPQALILMQDAKVSIAMLRQRPGWRTVPAVITGTVYHVDHRLDLPSPVAIDALEDLSRQFHP